jgi:hypothetical protein
MDPIDEIKQLYFKASAQSIEQDFARAIELLKQLPDEDARGRAAVYMEGLAEMRKEWERRQQAGHGKSRGKGPGRTKSTSHGKSKSAGPRR